MAVNIGGNLIWRLAVETKTHLVPANFYNIRRCVGLHVDVTIAMWIVWATTKHAWVWHYIRNQNVNLIPLTKNL